MYNSFLSQKLECQYVKLLLQLTLFCLYTVRVFLSDFQRTITRFVGLLGISMDWDWSNGKGFEPRAPGWYVLSIHQDRTREQLWILRFLIRVDHIVQIPASNLTFSNSADFLQIYRGDSDRISLSVLTATPYMLAPAKGCGTLKAKICRII